MRSHRERKTRFARRHEASGSCLTNKVLRGLPRRALYEGQPVIDKVEELAIAAPSKLFGATAAAGGRTISNINVQPTRQPGKPRVYLAFCQPGNVVMGRGLAARRSLTHGHTVSITGKYFNERPLRRPPEDQRIDSMRWEARQGAQTKLLWVGTTAYPRTLDIAAFRSNRRRGRCRPARRHRTISPRRDRRPSLPIGIADVVNLHPRTRPSAAAWRNDFCKKVHATAIDRPSFPGLQGGTPQQHDRGHRRCGARGARAFVKVYANAGRRQRKGPRCALMKRGFAIHEGGTHHLMLVDLTNKNIAGKPAAQALDRGRGIVGNYNAVPFDPTKAVRSVGPPLGTPPSRRAEWQRRDGNARGVDRFASFANPTDEAAIRRSRAKSASCARSFPRRLRI